MKYKIKAICRTDKGLIRDHNEDNFYFNNVILDGVDNTDIISCSFTSDRKKYFAVFDGMGGESHGEKASFIAAYTIKDSYSNFYEYINLANDNICNEQNGKYRMGSTVAGVQFFKDYFTICNLGDSKIFYFYDNKMVQLSEDHTDKKIIESCGSKKKPSLTQHLGIYKDEIILNPHIDNIKYQNSSIILICSDGLTDMVSNEEITNILNGDKTIEDKMDILYQKAFANGAKDNITVMLFEIKEFKENKIIRYLLFLLLIILILLMFLFINNKSNIKDECNNIGVMEKCTFVFDEKYHIDIRDNEIVRYENGQITGLKTGSTIIYVKDNKDNKIYEKKIVVYSK